MGFAAIPVTDESIVVSAYLSITISFDAQVKQPIQLQLSLSNTTFLVPCSSTDS